MIDYNNIARSITYYEARGFTRIESPWTVSKYASSITKPPEKIDYELKHNNKVLVASGEQSFIYLYIKGFLPLGKYQTVTPCFRDETFDDTHSKYFIKNELIITDDVSEDNLKFTMLAAKEFFEAVLEKEVKIVKYNHKCYDLFYENIELGSYGIREKPFLKWIYGTGCAEPRLSHVIKEIKF